jgi:hypothetical protein
MDSIRGEECIAVRSRDSKAIEPPTGIERDASLLCRRRSYTWKSSPGHSFDQKKCGMGKTWKGAVMQPDSH